MNSTAYGLWPLVILNSAIFIIFAFSFTKLPNGRDWRSFGAFAAFLVALFTEMYGFPLTIYLFSGWLQSHAIGVDIYSHESGHLWNTLIGWDINPHLDPFHLVSNILIVVGFILLSRAWRVLYKAQQEGALAVSGPYARMRHPQYVAFVIIMFGFMLQWPTLLTLIMFPILVFMYVKLSRREERAAAIQFGKAYYRYVAQTPAFIPRWKNSRDRPAIPTTVGDE